MPSFLRPLAVLMLAWLCFFPLDVLWAQRATRPENTGNVINGRILTETGEALPGVTVVVKGTTRGTQTDASGNFQLTAPPDGALTVSFVGYTTREVPVGAQTNFTLTLQEDTRALSEVVVVGYGAQRRSTLTGAVSDVSGNELIRSPQPNVTNSLVGRTPGLIAVNRSGEPGNDAAQLFIRGRGTLGDASPLIVIDGVANRLGSFDRIDPTEIESISILKDASAAIYGSQAANGVVLITTKRGKTGKPTVSYSFNQGLATPTRIPDMADAATFATIQNEIRYYQNPTAPQYVYTPDEIEKFRNGSDPISYPNTNWLRTILKPVSPQHRHTLGVSGGTESLRYLISVGNLFQDGFYRNGTANYNQYSIRANLDASIGKNLRIGLDLNGRQEDRNAPRDSASRIFRYALRAYPTLPAYYPNGLAGPGTDQGRNPVLQVTDALGRLRDRRTFLNATLRLAEQLPFVPGLSVDGFVAVDKQFRFDRQWDTPWTVYQYDATTRQYQPIPSGPPTPELSQRQWNETLLTLNARLAYERTLGPHRFAGFVAYEQSTYRRDYFDAFRTGFLSDRIDQLFAGDETGMRNFGTAFESARQNYFGRVQYHFSERYFAEFQARYDGSQNFPRARRFGFFPAASVAWRLSEEPWFKGKPGFVNNLKLRASYGLMGNDRIPQFQYLAAYGYDYYVLGDDPALVKGLRPTGVPNPNITWEVARTANVAVEGALFGGKLDFTVDYFHSRRNNILTKRNLSVPDYTGIILPDENIGIVINRGVDLQLMHSHTYGGINLSAGVNFTFARNKAVYLDEPTGLPDYQRQEGQPIWAPIRDLTTNGLFYNAIGIFRDQSAVDAYPHVLGAGPGDLRYEDVNGDGQITPEDRIRPRFSNIPEIVYGVPLTLSYKGFDFNLLVQGQARVSQYLLLESGSTGNFFAEDAANRWRPDNPDGTFPRVADKMYDGVNGAYPNTFWLKNAAFVRLKNVEFGYTIPRSLLDRLKIQSLRLYASGFNLLTLDRLKTIDPEGGSALGWFYPQQRIFNVGLNVRL